MHFTKLTAGLLALALLGAGAPGMAQSFTVCAEETVTSGTIGENVTWNFDAATGTLTISGEGRMDDGTMFGWIDPSNGAPLLDTSLVTAVVIEDGVSYIGGDWFRYIPNLTSVTMPENIETGMFAFRVTPWLEAIEPDENGLRIVGGVLLDGTGCTGDLTIPSDVQHIAGGAFVYTRGDTYMGAPAMNRPPVKVEIPSTVKTIGDCAFYHAAITELTLAEGLTKIGGSAFEQGMMETLTIPASVEQIGGRAFAECGSLTDITILNPDCKLEETFVSTKYDTTAFTGTIHGYDNSTAQTYAEKNGIAFVSLGEAPTDFLLGDVNLDGTVDSSDAADLLIALAEIGAGGDGGLTDTQRRAADVDGDGDLTAGDATVILQYAAYLGAGGTGTLPDYLAQLETA